MIQIIDLTKKFEETVALNNMSCNISEGTIFGLAGSNGSGKSTLLRTISGVYEPDGGQVLIDGENAFDNPQIKEKCFFISDYPFFFNDSTVEKMADMYRRIYSTWDEERYHKLCEMFPVGINKRIINMSKGMQRQASLIMAFAARPKYLFLDEIFDGLDPVIRRSLRTLIVQDVVENGMTCILASHNLREIDDICDKIVLIHNGKLLTNEDTDILKDKVHKVQLAFNDKQKEDLFDGMNVQIINKVGNYYSIMIKGNKAEILEQLNAMKPAFLEVLPSTLEEVFINEMGGAGYGK